MSHFLPDHIGCLYLHGFLSSPKSKKAQQLIQYFADRDQSWQLSVPTLPFEPAAAVSVAEHAYETLLTDARIKQVLVIGSSLGGFYATYLSDKYSCRSALINPAVKPYLLFDKYLGPNKHFYSGETHVLTMEHIEQLKALDVDEICQPEDLLLLLQTEDETLDYRQAVQKYRSCPSWLEAGGDHSFKDFMARLEMIWYFAD